MSARGAMRVATMAMAAAGLSACGERSDLFGPTEADAAPALDASSDDADAAGDGAPARSDPGIRCGQHDCDVDAGEVCCRNGKSEPFDYACARGGGCPAGQVAIRCDDATDCERLGHPGQVCCGIYDQLAYVTNVECRAAADCTDKQLAVPVCDPATDVPCPADAGTCNPSTQSLLGYSLCF